MKYFSLLPLAALSTAFVLPNEQVFNELVVETNNRQARLSDEASMTKERILDGFKTHYSEVSSTVKDVSDKAKNALDDALAFATTAGHSMTETAFDAKSWMENNVDHVYEALEEHEHPPHHGPPHHGAPVEPPHQDKPNRTVWELISESKYTTKLAKLIADYPDIVDSLNGTHSNFTIFTPIDSAFDKIPEHAPKPTKEQLKSLLFYHIVPDFYPAGRVLVTHTMPTLLKGEHLSSQPEPQRLSVNIGLKGLTLNFYSRVVAINIFGTNGVIHGVDSFIIPPPNVIKIIDLLPSEFSTLELGLGKTGLLDTLNSTDHPGGTFFAPSNFAFAKLGPKINAFLFSTYGQKYLKALLLYHVVPKTTLYSDAIYQAKSDDDEDKKTGCHGKHGKDVPKGYYHYDLPTMLEDRRLAVDVARYGGFISMKVNAFSRVSVQDGIAEDGVIQVVSDVLIPPKNGMQSHKEKSWKSWFGAGSKDADMTVNEFKSRFAGLVDDE